jgi:hypothetical protein
MAELTITTQRNTHTLFTRCSLNESLENSQNQLDTFTMDEWSLMVSKQGSKVYLFIMFSPLQLLRRNIQINIRLLEQAPSFFVKPVIRTLVTAAYMHHKSSSIEHQTDEHTECH